MKKIKETLTPIVDTKKRCGSKYSIDRLQGQHKKLSRIRKSGLTNSDNVVALL